MSRQRRSPNAAPSLRAVPGHVDATAATVEANVPEMHADVRSGMEKLQQQFRNLLRDQPELNTEDREQMAGYFEQALERASASSDTFDGAAFDRATWHDTVDSLRSTGSIDAEEADHLIRTINDALAPLESKESRLAIEFSQRLASQGEDQAIAWLRSQATASGQADASGAAAPVATTVSHPSLRGDVTQSKSRRLRGPPK